MHIRLLTLDPSCLSEDEFDSDFGLSEHEEEVDEESMFNDSNSDVFPSEYMFFLKNVFQIRNH